MLALSNNRKLQNTAFRQIIIAIHSVHRTAQKKYDKSSKNFEWSATFKGHKDTWHRITQLQETNRYKMNNLISNSYTLYVPPHKYIQLCIIISSEWWQNLSIAYEMGFFTTGTHQRSWLNACATNLYRWLCRAARVMSPYGVCITYCCTHNVNNTKIRTVQSQNTWFIIIFKY